MKKLYIIVFGVLLISCSDEQKYDVSVALNDFCSCSQLADEEKKQCHEAWVVKYKEVDGTHGDGEKLVEGMTECDAIGALEVLTKAQEASGN